MARKKPAEESPLIGVLKQAIRDSGLTLTELAKQTAVSHPQLSRFVAGKRTLTLPAAERLMEFFGFKLVRAKSQK
ncbi:MAG TPA: helix-turn-helix transcriptional regulator [Gemmataceae bacterium]|nr:helix-turn-helix transcriptional regulator [Gemmataceae bacterium]